MGLVSILRDPYIYPLIREDELRLAARMLFDASVSCLSDEETNMVAEHWQHHRTTVDSTSRLMLPDFAPSTMFTTHC